ncbi:MAG TPA: (Fe-S)-binding protein, partial [Anaeromyxobacteraceae bacterium]|nr:(Fe-S)-binding protein [Anaeromyxobacteraceae bacterium]
MNPLVTTALLIVAGSFFGFTLFRRTAPLFALRSAGRTDRPGERWKGLVRFGFGQRRLLDREELYSGVLHVVLFGAFLVLALRTITLFGMGFAEDFHLPLLGPESFLGRAYLLAKDVLVLGALAASLALLWRRLVSRPDRLTLSFEGNLILAFIAGLMITDILFDGASLFAQGGGGSLCAPAGLLGAAFYRGVGLSGGAVRAVGLASFWSHLGIVLAFGNLLPYGKHFHILTALPNVYFRALSPGSGALRKLDLEREDPEVGTQSVKDITWKEALDVYSCTECGRCQTHCPTYLTGKPLSHKEVNRAIRRHLAEKAPDLIQLARARAGPDREPAAPLPALSDVVPPET